jgi:hypothetical protein
MNEMLPPRNHNNPPEFIVDPEVLAECRAKASDFVDAGGDWIALGRIDTEDQSGKVTDFVDGARKVFKSIDEARKAAKAPHDERAKAVQAAFTPILEALTRTVDRVKALQADFLSRKAAEERAEKVRQAAAAARLKEEAEKAAAEAAARNDVVGEIEAEARLKEAEAAQKAAARPVETKAASATGGGRTMSLRNHYTCEIANINHAFVHFRAHPDVAALLIRLAEAEVRAQGPEKTEPSGFKIIAKETAA